MNDHKLVKYILLVLILPIALAMCSGDRFRYTCQDPANWDTPQCKAPICEVTRTCPEYIFKNGVKPGVVPAPTPAPTTGACK